GSLLLSRPLTSVLPRISSRTLKPANGSPTFLEFPLLGIPLRKFLPPFPLRANNRRQIRLRGLPPEHSSRFSRICNQLRRIARPPRLFAYRNRGASHLTRRLDHIEHRIPIARAEIDEIRLPSFAQMFERCDVRIGQIRHVNVIADCRSVRRRIIRPKNADFLA